jgi:hypothetical protein
MSPNYRVLPAFSPDRRRRCWIWPERELSVSAPPALVWAFSRQRQLRRERSLLNTGRKLTSVQADKLEARGNRYLYEINSRWTIDGTSRKKLGRYANHSCRPNAETHNKPQSHHTRHKEHQIRCGDYLQLRSRLPNQRHHAAWL